MIVQKLRLQRGWTQEDLAIVSGLSTRTIQRIERGQEPSADSLKALAAVFNVDFQSLKERDMQNAIVETGTLATSEAMGIATLAHQEALAFEHVRQIRSFYVQLLIYFVFMGLLLAYNLYATPHFLWVIFPALGWGIGLLAQAARIFKLLPFWGADWEKRQVEKYLGRKL